MKEKSTSAPQAPAPPRRIPGHGAVQGRHGREFASRLETPEPLRIMPTQKTLLLLALVLGMVPSALAAINRSVQLQVVGQPGGIEVTWTPRSALPGDYRLFPEYQLEVSTNLVDWQPIGPREPQRLGGSATPITRFIAHTTEDRLYVRVVDRLELRRDWFFQLINTAPTVDLRGADLRGANLDDVRLAGGLLFDGADLSNASLRRGAIGYASFRGAIFAGANATGASFYGTDLTGADFTRVDARGAYFGAAVLTNLNLGQANLRDARDFDETAAGLRFFNTILPDGSVRTN